MKLKYLLSGLAAAITLAFSASQALAVGTNVVIVEAYGGGGNSGSTYKNDFIGLFNRGTTTVDLTGWSVQYNSAAGAGTYQVTTLTGSIPAGGYYLVQESAGTGGTTSLPTPDATGTIAMGAGGFKVALVASTTALAGSAIATSPTVVDFVGAGGANAFEGTGPAQTPSNTTSDQRNNNGCTDTDNNTNDFTAAAPIPRNSQSPQHSCLIVVAPIISGVNPPNLTTNAGSDVTLTVSLSQGDAPLFYQWYTQSGDTLTSTPIPNATNSSLLLPSVLEANATNYVVVVTNNATANNSVTSSVVPLTVIDPAINVEPASQVVLPNGAAQFIALGAGTGISYQWYFNADPNDNSQTTGPLSDTTLPSGAVVSGSASSTLTITNVTVATQTNFVLVVTGTFGSITSSVVSLSVGTTAVPLAFWNFNGIFDPTNPAPFQGIGTAAAVSVVPFVQPTRDGDDITPGNNLAWGTQNYPATATVSNKQTGVQFNVSTLGAKNIKLSFDLRATTTASKYQRLQYTTNGTDFIDYPTSQLYVGTTYNSYAYDLTGFPGIANNTNFGIRIVAEFENTALYGNTNDATYVGASAGYSSAGTLSYDIVDITGDAIVGNNQPPTVSTIPAQSMEDGIGTNVTFTVSDDTTPAGSLGITATSLDPNNSVNFTPVNTSGTVHMGISSSLANIVPITVPVLVTVTDNNGDSTKTSFLLTIGPNNAAPVFSGLVTTNMLTNTTLVIPFTVSDDHTPVSALSPTVSSGNSLAVPNDTAHISLAGSAGNYTLTITPAAEGAVPITLSATDGGGLTGTKTFVLEVLPNTGVVLIDDFDYDAGAGTPLTAASAGLWQNHSGTAGGLKLTNSGLAVITGNASEDVNALLINGPYTTNSSAVLYSSYVVTFIALPDNVGAYFGHFKDNTTFGFLGRVWASITNAAPGDFRLGIANSTSTSTSQAQLSQDLTLNTPYTVVTRLVVATGISTIWINPTSESSPSATDPTDITTNKVNIYSYALREANSSEGTLTMDNLKVGTSFTAVTGLASTAPTLPVPTIGTISLGGPGGTNIIITGTNNNGTTSEHFTVLESTNVALPLSSWTSLGTQAFNADGTLNFTNGVGTDNQRYYILQALP